MPEQEPNNSTNAALSEKEIALKEREIALKEQETKAKIELDKRGVWFSSPLLIGVFSAIFGLLGTGIGAALQGYSSLQLERQKFESSLIQKALEVKDRNEAAKTLLFYVDSGVIQSLDGAKIRNIAENPKLLPALTQQLLVATTRGGAIAPSPDGKTFLIGGADGEVTVWSVGGRELAVFKGHTSSVTSVIYSPDGKLIFTGSLDETVNILDTSGRIVRKLSQRDGVLGLAISPDGKTLIVRTANREIALWNIATQKRVDLIKLTSSSPQS